LLFGLAGLFGLLSQIRECLSDRLAAHALEFAKALSFYCPGFGSSPFGRAVLQLLLAKTAKLECNHTLWRYYKDADEEPRWAHKVPSAPGRNLGSTRPSALARTIPRRARTRAPTRSRRRRAAE
jgi:hypothetical protein